MATFWLEGKMESQEAVFEVLKVWGDRIVYTLLILQFEMSFVAKTTVFDVFLFAPFFAAVMSVT
jgi:hypothetical protein